MEIDHSLEALFRAIDEWLEIAAAVEGDIHRWARSREVILGDGVEVHLSLKTRRLRDFGLDGRGSIRGVEMVKITVAKDFRRLGLSTRVVRRLVDAVNADRRFGYFAVTEVISRKLEAGLEKHFSGILARTDWGGSANFYTIKDVGELSVLKEEPRKTRRFSADTEEPPQKLIFF